MSTNKLNPLTFRQNITLGCDPEFFFARDGQVIGSEKILPREGVHAGDKYSGKVVIDGVQAELNPIPSNCRESLAYEIHRCFTSIKNLVDRNGAQVSADAIVDITQQELNSLSESSRQFGCAPSRNIYDAGSKIHANPATYLKRSAGGHLHLGNEYEHYLINPISANRPLAEKTEAALKQMPEITVPILDVIVGNTCVLLDRNEGNAERRKNYGRVGEFRLKGYGLEYRTLSNFWLRSYPLMSFVFAMARMAVNLVAQSTEQNDYVKAIFNVVNRDDITEAVQQNNFDVAMKNFKAIEPILNEVASDPVWPLGGRMASFHHFVNRIAEKGLQYWFPDDTFKHWTEVSYDGNIGSNVYLYRKNGGWERFCQNVIDPDLFNNHVIDLSNKKVEVVVA